MTRIDNRIKRRKSPADIELEVGAERLRNKNEIIRSANEIAQQEDMDKRFGSYNNDISIGNMYQRKKKTKKAKSKRKIKRCGCK